MEGLESYRFGHTLLLVMEYWVAIAFGVEFPYPMSDSKLLFLGWMVSWFVPFHLSFYRGDKLCVRLLVLCIGVDNTH